ncbi:MAG TPA: hypothetical protein VEC37_12765, partial [Bacillota bacterium]|nr:hypothetical protein [Bacillota bacterium]
MADSIKDSLPNIYNNSWEHLHDELKLLDLILERQVLLCRESGSLFSGDSFRGLTITESEIIQLLAASKETSRNDLSCVQQLTWQIEQLDSEIRERIRFTCEQGKYLSLQRLIDIFKLNEFETKVLIIALAPELDVKYEKIYGFLQDDLSRKKPGIHLVLNLLCRTVEEQWIARLAFEPATPLVRYLIEIIHYPSDAPPTLIRQCIKLEHRIVNFLLEYNQVDDRIHNWVELKSWEPQTLLDGDSQQLSKRIKDFLQQLRKPVPDGTAKVIFYFSGPWGVGKKYRVQQICQQFGIPVLIADIRRVLHSGRVGNENIRFVGREAVLQQAALCFDNFDLLADEHGNYSSIDFLELDKSILNFGLPLFLLGRDVINIDNASNYVVIQVEQMPPDLIQRKKLWQTMAAGFPVNPD